MNYIRNNRDPFPFREQWFKDLSITEKCKWLVSEARARTPQEFKTPEIVPAIVVPEHITTIAFDAAQDEPKPLVLNPEARKYVIDTLKQNIEWEIALPTFRAYRIGENTRHSAFSIISLAHCKAMGVEPEETDKFTIDAVDNKYQYHYSNLHEALRWAFGSDNPELPNTLGLPLTNLRDLLCMTKKANKRSKLKFSELIDILERL